MAINYQPLGPGQGYALQMLPDPGHYQVQASQQAATGNILAASAAAGPGHAQVQWGRDRYNAISPLLEGLFGMPGGSLSATSSASLPKLPQMPSFERYNNQYGNTMAGSTSGAMLAAENDAYRKYQNDLMQYHAAMQAHNSRQSSAGNPVQPLGGIFGALLGSETVTGNSGGSPTGQQPEITEQRGISPHLFREQLNSILGGAASALQGSTALSIPGAASAAGMATSSPAVQALSRQATAGSTASAQNALTRAFMDKYANDSSMLLSTQSAREQQFANRQREQLTNQSLNISRQGQLMGLLSQILGSVL